MSLLIQIFVVRSGLVRYQITEDWKLDKSTISFGLEVILRVEEREYIEPEKVSEEVINAINIVKEYCKSHEDFEDCRHCVLGDGIHNCGCSSPWLWDIRK